MVKVNENTQKIIDSAQKWLKCNRIPPEAFATSVDIESDDDFRSEIDELVQKMTDEEVEKMIANSVVAGSFLLKKHIARTICLVQNIQRERESEKRKKLDDIAEDLLLDATDLIGNDPEAFNADNKALETMRNNSVFREHVKKVIREADPEEYEEAMKSQCQAAIFVWKLYVVWAYVPKF